MARTIPQKNRDRRDRTEYDFSDVSYTLPPQDEFAKSWYSSPENDAQLGEIREPEVFETEHHVYSCPFRYKNVSLAYWSENSAKGHEFLADVGSITITETMPVVEVVCVGSGCSGNNYNIVEWWNEGESIRSCKGQLVKRQRVGNLQGQHPAFLQAALSQQLPEFKSLDEANEFLKRIQRQVHGITSNYTMPGSLMSGLYENTVHFRIGDTSNPELTVKKVVIRGGGLDYEDPYGADYRDGDRNRYPADYVFRLIDIIVKKESR